MKIDCSKKGVVLVKEQDRSGVVHVVGTILHGAFFEINFEILCEMIELLLRRA
jgi:hypothetical protein